MHGSSINQDLMLPRRPALGALRPIKSPKHVRHFIFRLLDRILPSTGVEIKINPEAFKKPRIIFSGIQPTGVPHLGNYLGALREWVRLQDEDRDDTKCVFSLVDLHAITIKQNPDQLREWRDQSLAMLMAIGLDPDKSAIFFQSQVPAHSELMWILSCQASTGYLSRMTQWKEKIGGDKANVERQKLGLFSYPVLQAADVLLYQATHVPVGHDQAQHLEFTRELANSFNSTHNEKIFRVPETIISPARRVMSLTDPASKMSKSHPNPKSRILLTDDTDVVNAKLRAAVTDSLEGITYDPAKRPGVSNLIDMLYHIKFEGSEVTKQDLALSFEGASLKALKETVADAVNELLGPIRDKYHATINNKLALEIAQIKGALGARLHVAPTLAAVHKAMGLNSGKISFGKIPSPI